MSKPTPKNLDVEELMAHPPPYPPFEREPINYVMSLGLDFDLESQLRAVRRQLQLHKAQDEKTDEEISLLVEEARRSEEVHPDYIDERYIDRIHDSTYESAALSMAAVGMLAPLTETLLHQCLLGIAQRFYCDRLPVHDRLRYAKGQGWDDCHLHFGLNGRRKDLVAGFSQLVEALAMTQYFPSNVGQTLQALFAYRNKMFHHGFEWPEKERIAFSNRIQDEGWPAAWFSRATTGGKPWVFYMTSSFIEHCLQTIYAIIAAFGNYVRDIESEQA